MKASAFPIPSGQPFPKVVKFFRRYMDRNWQSTFTRSDVRDYFGESLTDEMLASGLIEPARQFNPGRNKETDYGGAIIRGHYRITYLGRRLAGTLLVPRLPRARAELIVPAMLERAEAINADQELLTWINRIILFGRYLGKNATLGDIDVGVEIRHKRSDLTYMREHALRRARKPWPRDHSGHLDVVAEAHNRLKNRERYLQIADAHIVDKLRTPRKRVIWPTLPSPWVHVDGKEYFSQRVQDEIDRRKSKEKGRRRRP